MNDREEFERKVRELFNLPSNIDWTRTAKGYKNGHLNAYYKIWKAKKDLKPTDK